MHSGRGVSVRDWPAATGRRDSRSDESTEGLRGLTSSLRPPDVGKLFVRAGADDSPFSVNFQITVRISGHDPASGMDRRCLQCSREVWHAFFATYIDFSLLDRASNCGPCTKFCQNENRPGVWQN